jgi:hypothetical protein
VNLGVAWGLPENGVQQTIPEGFKEQPASCPGRLASLHEKPVTVREEIIWARLI